MRGSRERVMAMQRCFTHDAASFLTTLISILSNKRTSLSAIYQHPATIEREQYNFSVLPVSFQELV